MKQDNEKSILLALQNIELDMLKHTINICEKLNLKYYLLGGTLLGAVRHGGFIPWDDDIDIGMPREDYEIFIKEAQKYYPDNMFVQHYTTERNMPVPWCKIRRSDTAFMEINIRRVKMNKGIFIDVFPLDYYPETEKQRRYIHEKDLLLKSVMLRKLFPPSPGIKNTVASIKHKIKTHFITFRTSVKKRDLLHRTYREGTKIANYNGAWGEKEIVPAEWYGDGAILTFEGIKCRVPVEYDKWLTQVYGDYMTLPPEEKRITHHETDYIDTKKSYLEYEAMK